MPYLLCKKIENDVYNFPTWQYCKYKDIFDSRIIINSTAKFYISISYQKDLLSIDTRIFTPSVVTELSPQEWVYNKFTTYVLTHKECNSSQQIHFTSENPVLLLERLKQEAGKDIWICGGANLVQQLVSKNMIDKYYISVIPTLLGNGVRLLGNIDREIKLRLCKTQTYNGITDLIYMRR